MSVPNILGLVLSAALCTTVAAQRYPTVFSSVVITRTGERTPLVLRLEDHSQTTQLTSAGAWSIKQVGSFFRERYLGNGAATLPSTMISNISTSVFDIDQLDVRTGDDQFLYTSAQAFLQGLYPTEAASNSTTQYPEPTFEQSLVGDSLYGYQYPWIHSVSGSDPNSIFVDGSYLCKMWDNGLYYLGQYSGSFSSIVTSTSAFMQNLGEEMGDALISEEYYTFANAYYAYDYLSFKYNYNDTIRETLSTGSLGSSNAYNHLRYLSDQWANYAYGSGSSENHASTIAGTTLITQVLSALSASVHTGGSSSRLSLYFTDFEPLYSFFSLVNLTDASADFYGLPEFGSSLVFELVSYSDNEISNTAGNTASFPSDPSELYVRFLFRNGTSGDLVEYPLSNVGNASDWDIFSTVMSNLSFNDPVLDWCRTCKAEDSVSFCKASALPIPPQKELSVQTAVAITVFATLGSVFLVIAAIMFFGKIRLTRRTRKNELGGFKGSAKLASDADLSLPKNAANVAVVEQVGHERIGSWELKAANKEHGFENDLYTTHGRATARDGASIRSVSPVQDDERWAKPASPSENV